MDPFLERADRWGDFHTRFINVASDLLNAKLLPRYAARIEERVYLEDEEDEARSGIIPDIRILKNPLADGDQPVSTVSHAQSGSALVIEAKTLIEDEVHEPRLEVVDLASGAVIAVIELLSPSNKRRGSSAWRSYREKRLEVMHSKSHFVEIDLLRQGERFVKQRRLPPHEYLVHVSPEPRRPRGLLYPIRLDEPLPSIDIPLKKDDPEVRLNLQTAVETLYDRAGYAYQIDYKAPPQVPLDERWTAWADELLKAKKLR
jgi:hypothetical protein